MPSTPKPARDWSSTVLTEIEYLTAKFESPETRLSVPLTIESKFPDRPFIPNDQTNPSIKNAAGNVNFAFQAKKMLDFDYISKLVEYVVRMIAFANKHYPLSRSPYLWSDYDDLAFGSQTSERALSLSNAVG